MSVAKNSSRFGKKPAATSAPRNGGKKSSAKKTVQSSAANLSRKKRSKSSGAYSSLKSKQMTVDRMKRSIWASLQRINDAIINNATTGNLAAAKELFDFAGVYSLPMPDDENAAAAAAPAPASEAATAEPAPVHPIDLFFKKIGVEPSCAEPEPGVA